MYCIKNQIKFLYKKTYYTNKQINFHSNKKNDKITI